MDVSAGDGGRAVEDDRGWLRRSESERVVAMATVSQDMAMAVGVGVGVLS